MKNRPIHARLAFTPATAYISYNGAGVDNLIAIILEPPREMPTEGGEVTWCHRTNNSRSNSKRRQFSPSTQLGEFFDQVRRQLTRLHQLDTDWTT